MSSSPEKRTCHLQSTSSPLQVVRLTTGWWPGLFTPPRLKCSSTEHSDEGPGDSSTLISLDFRADLQSSCLCDGFISSTLSEDDALGDDASVMASRLDEVVTALLDAHAPMTEITCRVRRSSDWWYDSECRSAKHRARGHERRFKRSRTDAARDSWMGALKTMHRLVRSKRKHFWRSRVDTGRDQASLWRVINNGLGRGGDGAPVADPGL